MIDGLKKDGRRGRHTDTQRERERERELGMKFPHGSFGEKSVVRLVGDGVLRAAPVAVSVPSFSHQHGEGNVSKSSSCVCEDLL